jgi:hypothetical protein
MGSDVTDAARRPRKYARCSPVLVAAAVALGIWWAALLLVLAVDRGTLLLGRRAAIAKSDYAPEAAPIYQRGRERSGDRYS